MSKHPCRAVWTRVLGATHKHRRKVTQGLTPELRNVLARTVLSTLLSFRLPIVPLSGCCRRYGGFVLSTNSTWYKWPFCWSPTSDRSAPSKLLSPTTQRYQHGHLVYCSGQSWSSPRWQLESKLPWWKGKADKGLVQVSKGPLQRANDFWWGQPRRAKLSAMRILFWVRIQVKTLHLFYVGACQMSWF